MRSRSVGIPCSDAELPSSVHFLLEIEPLQWYNSLAEPKTLQYYDMFLFLVRPCARGILRVLHTVHVAQVRNSFGSQHPHPVCWVSI